VASNTDYLYVQNKTALPSIRYLQHADTIICAHTHQQGRPLMQQHSQPQREEAGHSGDCGCSHSCQGQGQVLEGRQAPREGMNIQIVHE
jgi:hypothetical protein